MTATIIPFPARPAPHISGEAVCAHCRAVWDGCAPVGTCDLECPSCGTAKGAFVRPILYDEPYWTCRCGCFTFRVGIRQGVYCIDCGIPQGF